MHIQELACCWLDEGLAASLVAGSASQRAWTKEAKLLHSAALPLKCVLSILEGSGFQQWAESTPLGHLNLLCLAYCTNLRADKYSTLNPRPTDAPL